MSDTTILTCTECHATFQRDRHARNTVCSEACAKARQVRYGRERKPRKATRPSAPPVQPDAEDLEDPLRGQRPQHKKSRDPLRVCAGCHTAYPGGIMEACPSCGAKDFVPPGTTTAPPTRPVIPPLRAKAVAAGSTPLMDRILAMATLYATLGRLALDLRRIDEADAHYNRASGFARSCARAIDGGRP